jgi:hypothetical protein
MMKKLIYLFIAFGICLSTTQVTAQSSNLTQAYENGFDDGYNLGTANNTAGYQAALAAVNSYTTGGGPGSATNYLATYRNALAQGWVQGQNSQGGAGCSLPGCNEEDPNAGQSLGERWWSRFFYTPYPFSQ